MGIAIQSHDNVGPKYYVKYDSHASPARLLHESIYRTEENSLMLRMLHLFVQSIDPMDNDE